MPGQPESTMSGVWASTVPPCRKERRVRLITMAWGARYIEGLFSFTLPAILAPHNLPMLAEHFDCELVIVTEEDWFARLQRQPVFQRLGQLCRVELRPIDDLISRADAYGMALTYALFRGFEDLGSAMVDVPLIFFNADFILADGSLQTVAGKLLAGERLILAPSYCVKAESVTPWLVACRDPETPSIAVAPRQMAAMAIKHRHNTIRGKTVNQRVFSVEWMDQFYWLVNEETLIAHQMPFAVVAMRPERVLTEMRTFWDYGIISEACPTTPRCVIADSDDFLMIELRSAKTARDQLCLGWPEPKQIGEKLARFITRDPIELARYTLMLHSGDLPPDLESAKARLDEFVSAVLAELPPEPTPWVNHPNWAYHYAAFHEAREAFLARRAQLAATGSALPAVREPSTGPALTVNGTGRGLKGAAQQLYYKHFGRAPWLQPLHPRWADAQPVVQLLRKFPEARLLIVHSTSLQERLFANLVGRQMSLAAFDPAPSDEEDVDDGNTADRQVRKLRIASDREFEVEIALGDRTPIERVKARSLELILNSRYEAEYWLPENTTPTNQVLSAEKYDLCIFELNADDLLQLSSLLSRIEPWMEPEGKILVFHLNMIGASGAAQKFIRNDAFWLDLPCRLHFAGSEDSLRAVNAFHEGIAGLRTRRLLPAARGLARVSTACLAALRASKSERIHSQRAPSVFTSLTLEIDVLPRAGSEIAGNGHAQVTA
jgi:hypothetical protein